MMRRKVDQSNDQGNKVEAILNWAKNNVWIAPLIVLGTIVVTIASFTDAVNKLRAFCCAPPPGVILRITPVPKESNPVHEYDYNFSFAPTDSTESVQEVTLIFPNTLEPRTKDAKAPKLTIDLSGLRHAINSMAQQFLPRESDPPHGLYTLKDWFTVGIETEYIYSGQLFTDYSLYEVDFVFITNETGLPHGLPEINGFRLKGHISSRSALESQVDKLAEAKRYKFEFLRTGL